MIIKDQVITYDKDGTVYVDMTIIPDVPIKFISYDVLFDRPSVRWWKSSDSADSLTMEFTVEHGSIGKDPFSYIGPALEWCEQYNIPAHRGHNSISFDTEKDMTMFILKWG